MLTVVRRTSLRDSVMSSQPEKVDWYNMPYDVVKSSQRTMSPGRTTKAEPADNLHRLLVEMQCINNTPDRGTSQPDDMYTR